jgi:hypothetical protein
MPETANVLSFQQIRDQIPSDVSSLLWFKDGPNRSEEFEGDQYGLGGKGFTIMVSYLGAIEPSSIGYGKMILEPPDASLIERPCYLHPMRN